MSHTLTADGLGAEVHYIPSDLRIPMPPRTRWIPAQPRAPWWREAMRWSLIGLTASLAAGEVTLLLLFP
jgi:hypothetical protein